MHPLINEPRGRKGKTGSKRQVYHRRERGGKSGLLQQVGSTGHFYQMKKKYTPENVTFLLPLALSLFLARGGGWRGGRSAGRTHGLGFPGTQEFLKRIARS